jgi:tetratricopeptide (TPR) repeat protein
MHKTITPILITLLLACLASAQTDESVDEFVEEPLYRQEPYDLITLVAKDENSQNKVLKVEALDLSNRRLPKNPRRSKKLLVVLVDEPGKTYELRWGSIAKVDLFEQLVLREAIELFQAGRSEEAFDYFVHLEHQDPDLPGLAEAIGAYLYREAGVQHNKRQYHAALAMLRELFRRNPKNPKTSDAMGLATEELVQGYVAQKQFEAARILLQNLAVCYPKHRVVLKWEGQLKRQAGGLMTQARKTLEASRFREADKACHRMMQIWPQLPGARELVETIHKKYPRVVIGVSMPATGSLPHVMDDWASYRGNRLLFRTLMEFDGPGSEGGTYYCPMGRLEIDDLGRRLSFQISPNIHWAGTRAVLTGGDVARRLLALADPRDPAYRAGWADLFHDVSVRDVYRADVELRRPHVRPDAYLQTIIPPYNSPSLSDRPNLTNGPYVVDSRTADEVVYVANKRYFATGPTQPKEVVERVFPEGKPPILALQSGRVHALARVYPWDLQQVGLIESVVVEPYAVPWVHCLIPNTRRPLMARRTFRRGLLVGIHREAILQHLLGGRIVAGCRVLSGPFPAGKAFNDPLGYAYDWEIEPRPYQPSLAIVLAGVAADRQRRADEKKQGAARTEQPDETKKEKNNDKKKDGKDEDEEEKEKPVAQIVLAHPPHEIARVACEQIQSQLKLIKILVTLRELPPGRLERIPDDVDLVYAELPVWEPVVDARLLLGESGLSGGATPYMRLALGKLQRANDWREVRAALRHIHRIAHNDVAVLPLWQLTDFFAYHRSLRGVGAEPVSLYQNIEQWKISLQDTTKAP